MRYCLACGQATSSLQKGAKFYFLLIHNIYFQYIMD